MGKTKIEWSEVTWNPVTGCDAVSPGCDNCYAESMAKRLKAMGSYNYRNGFKVTLHPHMLDKPKSWQKSRLVFVNSMSDMFHPKVTFDFVSQVFDTMRNTPKHTYQILTKRPKTMAFYVDRELGGNVPENVWLGTSVESHDYKARIDALREIPGPVRFLSLEPLIGDLGKLDLGNIDWVIVGGESGPGCRPMLEEWVMNIKSQCDDSGVPFFFKQWGGVRKKETGRELLGQTWDDMPESVLGR